MSRSNCFFFAAVAWWRWRRHGAYWWVRQSRHITGWHWGVYHRGRFIHYEPVDPKPDCWHAALHKIWYHGMIKRNDWTVTIRVRDIAVIELANGTYLLVREGGASVSVPADRFYEAVVALFRREGG